MILVRSRRRTRIFRIIFESISNQNGALQAHAIKSEIDIKLAKKRQISKLRGLTKTRTENPNFPATGDFEFNISRSKQFQGVFHFLIQDVGIDLGGLQVYMPKGFLDDPQVLCLLKQFGGESMPQRVR